MPSADVKNKQMRMTCSELASKYATYPLQRKTWLMVDGTGPDSAPAFMEGSSDESGLKEHYVYGKGPKDATGYYHLLTREAYKILYKRVRSEAPAGGAVCPCFSSQETRDQIDAWDTTKTICWNRSVSSQPDDQIAQDEAIKIAKQVANKTFNRTQNEQLVVGTVLILT
eukprot:CAMPEP_0198145374 /NCGR_PEP_ID=MMETSP1443-20131203/23046_1 /TAXON_ID=186043 /ORGANISM="Entomoneis sp., Strain CCMP2396" /LENGTH=168 /DNA_ID=CAMNT_0043809003 /DNA_START=80 /DNA_END=586 /DNA_ORIENTATION=+